MLMSWWQRVGLRASSTSTNRSNRQNTKRGQGGPQVECLEARDVPTVFTPAHLSASHVVPFATSGSTVYTPQQVSHAYGFDQIGFNGTAANGSGTTIAIVDAYDNPNIAGDLQTFDAQFNLPNPVFKKVNQS